MDNHLHLAGALGLWTRISIAQKKYKALYLTGLMAVLIAAIGTFNGTVIAVRIKHILN